LFIDLATCLQNERRPESSRNAIGSFELAGFRLDSKSPAFTWLGSSKLTETRGYGVTV